MNYFRQRPPEQPPEAFVTPQEDDLDLARQPSRVPLNVFQPRANTLILLVTGALAVLLLAVIGSANDAASPVLVPLAPHVELVANSTTTDAATDTIEDALAPIAITNPSFEERDDTGFARGWQLRDGITRLDTHTVLDGQTSLRVESDSATSFFSRQALDLAPNTRYVLRANVKTEGVVGQGAGFRLSFGDGRVQSEGLRGTHDWRILEERFTTPDEIDGVFLDLLWNIEAGTVWYDKLELTVDDGRFNRNQEMMSLASFNSPDVSVRAPAQVPIGVFQSGAALNGLDGFTEMVSRLKSAGMDSAIVIERSGSASIFEHAEAEDFHVILMPNYELDRSWWADEFPDTTEQASRAADAIVDNLETYESLLAYALVDEPHTRMTSKVCNITDAFRETTDAPVTGVFVGTNRGELIFRDCQPDILLIDIYPFNQESALGEFNMRGFGYNNLDFVDYIRRYTRFKTPGQPLWVLLQTHSTDWPDYKLREPTPEELRAMNWLAVGEGASGFFYFHWTTAQTWRGLADNPMLLTEVASFSQRIAGIEPLLLNWHKTDDLFFVAATDAERLGYTSTLTANNLDLPEDILSASLTQDGQQMFVTVVNRDVQESREFYLEALPTLPEIHLANIETGARQALSDPILLDAGSGAVFLVLDGPLEATAQTLNIDFGVPASDVPLIDTQATETVAIFVETPTDDVSDTSDDTATNTVVDTPASADSSNLDSSSVDVSTYPPTTPNNNVTDSSSSELSTPESSTPESSTPESSTSESSTSESSTPESQTIEPATPSEATITSTLNPTDAPAETSSDETVAPTETDATASAELPAPTRARDIENGSVPFYPIDWSVDVGVWWDRNPLNPANGGFDPASVVHPQPRVNVCDYQAGSETAGLAEAIDALPLAGGTLWLPQECGPYVVTAPLELLHDRYMHEGQLNITRRSNLHFLSDGARILSDPSFIPEGDEYTLINMKSMEMQDTRTEGNPDRNYYFENLVIDGGNILYQGLSFDGIRDVFIYDVRFENFATYDKKHPGVIRAAIQSDNLWCIRCEFTGGAHAIYVDGSHNSGVIDSTFTGDYRNAILLLTNDDTAPFSEQQRSAQYYVIANNTFEFERGSIIQMAAANSLVTDNIVRGTHRHFVGSDGKWSGTLEEELIYDFYGNIIRDNTIEGSLSFFLEVSGWDEGGFERYNIGNFVVEGNRADSVRAVLNLRPRFPEASIDNIDVRNNVFLGVRDDVLWGETGSVSGVRFLGNVIEYD
ncbi:MAG: beta-galactosidase [Deinococcota bacterium]